MIRLALALCVVAAVSACHAALLPPAVRKDVMLQMNGAKPKLLKCYEAALLQNSKMKGALLVRFEIQAETGAFLQPQVRRVDMDDPVFDGCVLGVIETLALRTPQNADVSVDYPMYFTTTVDDSDDDDDDDDDDE